MADPPDVLVVDVAGLKRRGSRPGLVDYLLQVWDARIFTFHEARTHVQNSSQNQFLGNLWLIINPILDGAVFYVIFGLILKLDRGIPNYVGFLLIGVFLFQMTSRCVNSSASSLLKLRDNTSDAPLPALTAPLHMNLRAWLTGLPSYAVLLGMILLIPPIENLSPVALLFLFLLVVQAALNLGISLIVSHVVGVIPDLQNLLRVATRAWMYGSGVMFAADRFQELGPVFAFLIHWNPMYWILDIARDVLIYDRLPSPDGWLIALLWAVSTLLLGAALIWRHDGRYRGGRNG